MDNMANINADEKAKNNVREKVIRLLEIMGVNEDGYIMDFAIDKCMGHIKNYCNIDMLPPQLEIICADMVMADILRFYKDSGKLENCNIDKITSIREGDTQINYAEGDSPSARIERLIAHLSHTNDLLRFRRLAW